MPTGYTAAVNDGTVTSLRDYALTCARAFGALIEMRDDPLNRPAPRRLPAQPSYHEGALRDAVDTLHELLNLTDEQKTERAEAANAQAANDRQEAIELNKAIRDRYNAMLGQVEQWTAPSDLDGLREFMLEQLTSSIEFDVTDEPGKYVPPSMTPAVWWAESVKRAADDVTYHQKHLAEDNQRAAARQVWLDTLWASLPEEGVA